MDTSSSPQFHEMSRRVLVNDKINLQLFRKTKKRKRKGLLKDSQDQNKDKWKLPRML